MSTDRSYIFQNLSGGPVTTDRQGIDYLVVGTEQLTIEAFFFKPLSNDIEPGYFKIEGGERVRQIGIVKAKKFARNAVRLTLERFGDWSPYRLVIPESAWGRFGFDMDPAFSSAVFSFKVNCPVEVDCKSHPREAGSFPAIRNFDYQAKDFESFKQSMLDRLSATIPGWWDRAEADFGIALVDLLAYAGDRLSYFQDRVAAESHLKTARSRQSVAGHLKLIDYKLDPGQTATALVQLDVKRDMVVPRGTVVGTPAKSYEERVPFTLREPFPAYEDMNELRLYDFSHPSLFIPAGTLEVAIAGHHKDLEKGAALIIVQDGNRHLVRLSEKPALRKAPDGTDITVLAWERRYAIPWDISLSRTRVLGNIAELFHGETMRTSLYVKGELEYFDLPEGPLGYRNGRPMIDITVDGEVWQAVESLKESAPYDRHYQVVDMDNGRNRIIFGDNVNGFRPEPYSVVEIEYHAGLGSKGNVAEGTLTALLSGINGVTAVNHFAAHGGRDPETEEHGRLWGPKKIRIEERAVTPGDYEREAMAVPGVSRAIARFVWTGSWFTVRITLDPEGSEELTEELREAVYGHLMSRKMAGYDMQIVPVRYVPLEISIRFCLNNSAFRDRVSDDLKKALGNKTGPDGTKGFFHPDNWFFGKGVELSSLYAAVARVPDIECAEVVLFKRLRKPATDEIDKGEIPMQWDEIARLDNDRSLPEHGRLDIVLAGGR